ncbi:MAG TPA: putative peptidoglycan glycosyltransferase FtsW, partial [bacterium]|nr:putative peptidoglycan glycosyltransferase FtsW [bacterium]
MGSKLVSFRIVNLKVLLLTYLFAFLGAVLIFDASSAYSIVNLGNPYYFFLKQIVWILLGSAALFVFTVVVDYWDLKRAVFPLLFLSFLLLVLIYIPGVGKTVNHARRWLRIGPVNLQPAEILKIVWIIYLADFMDRNRSRIKKIKTLLGPALFLVIFSALVYKQPDLGSVIILVLSFAFMIFLGGFPLRYIAGFILSTLPLLYFALFHVGYRRHRMLSFLNPFEYAQGKAWQLVQSLIAMGSGGLFGKGPVASQAKLLYLPYAHTDFIFPIIGEEFGFAGSLILLGLYFMLFYQAITISLNIGDYFAKLLASGLIFLIIIQALINIAVATGLLPTKGMT